MKSEKINKDLIIFVKQYIEDVYKYHSIIESDPIDIIIMVSPPDAKFEIIFDPLEMIIIIDNFISNSQKAKSNQIIFNIFINDAENLEIHIRDDGTGIKSNLYEKIFDFGFSSTGGMGVGLSQVKKIINKYGTIKVNEEYHDGAEFIMEVNK